MKNSLAYRQLVITIIALFSTWFCVQTQANADFHKRVSAAITINGNLVDHDATKVLVGQTVFVPDFSTLSLTNKAPKNSSRFSNSNAVTTHPNCLAPKQPYLAYSCTDSLGNFSIRFIPKVGQLLKLVIGEDLNTIEINSHNSDVYLGVISIQLKKQSRNNKIAIVAPPALVSQAYNHINTTNKNAVTYMLDSEILAAYQINSTEFDIEYHQNLLQDDEGKSILDVSRYTTILVKGNWQNISEQFSQKTITLMLKYVENGGQLLIKNNRIYQNNNYDKSPYI